MCLQRRRAFGFAYGGIRAAFVLHERLVTHVLRKKSAFFDVTPSGRVVNRFSRDAFSVDDPLAFHVNILLAQVMPEISRCGRMLDASMRMPQMCVMLVQYRVKDSWSRLTTSSGTIHRRSSVLSRSTLSPPRVDRCSRCSRRKD